MFDNNFGKTLLIRPILKVKSACVFEQKWTLYGLYHNEYHGYISYRIVCGQPWTPT